MNATHPRTLALDRKNNDARDRVIGTYEDFPEIQKGLASIAKSHGPWWFRHHEALAKKAENPIAALLANAATSGYGILHGLALTRAERVEVLAALLAIEDALDTLGFDDAQIER